MAYFEFFKLPDAAGFESAAIQPTPADSRNEKQPEWAEGKDADVTISLGLDSAPNQRGWIGTGPQHASVFIARRVRLPSDDRASPNIRVGDLLLYRVALLSTKESWPMDTGKSADWPGVYLEFDGQRGLRLKATLRRLVIDDWALQVETDQGRLSSVRETLSLRGSVVKLENIAGNPMEVTLSDAAR
jgi:hypothetical protein